MINNALICFCLILCLYTYGYIDLSVLFFLVQIYECNRKYVVKQLSKTSEFKLWFQNITVMRVLLSDSEEFEQEEENDMVIEDDPDSPDFIASAEQFLNQNPLSIRTSSIIDLTQDSSDSEDSYILNDDNDDDRDVMMHGDVPFNRPAIAYGNFDMFSEQPIIGLDREPDVISISSDSSYSDGK